MRVTPAGEMWFLKENFIRPYFPGFPREHCCIACRYTSFNAVFKCPTGTMEARSSVVVGMSPTQPKYCVGDIRAEVTRPRITTHMQSYENTALATRKLHMSSHLVTMHNARNNTTITCNRFLNVLVSPSRVSADRWNVRECQNPGRMPLGDLHHDIRSHIIMKHCKRGSSKCMVQWVINLNGVSKKALLYTGCCNSSFDMMEIHNVTSNIADMSSPSIIALRWLIKY